MATGSANTGYKSYTTLEQYYTDNSAATGTTKANTLGDPDYIAPVFDDSTCPIPTSYSYSVRLDDTSIGTICSQVSTVVYSSSSAWSAGMALYTDSGLTTRLSSYIYVDYIVSGQIFNLNIGTGVVGSYTGSNC